MQLTAQLSQRGSHTVTPATEPTPPVLYSQDPWNSQPQLHCPPAINCLSSRPRIENSLCFRMLWLLSRDRPPLTAPIQLSHWRVNPFRGFARWRATARSNKLIADEETLKCVLRMEKVHSGFSFSLFLFFFCSFRYFCCEVYVHSMVEADSQLIKNR